jgi:hypothetical protein
MKGKHGSVASGLLGVKGLAPASMAAYAFLTYQSWCEYSSVEKRSLT